MGDDYEDYVKQCAKEHPYKNIKTDRTVDVVLHTVIPIDKCIAKEIEELNHKYGIITVYSCCGHGYRKGAFIAVRDEFHPKMIALDYNSIKKRGIAVNNIFKPKSKCNCEKNSVGV